MEVGLKIADSDDDLGNCDVCGSPADLVGRSFDKNNNVQKVVRLCADHSGLPYGRGKKRPGKTGLIKPGQVR